MYINTVFLNSIQTPVDTRTQREKKEKRNIHIHRLSSQTKSRNNKRLPLKKGKEKEKKTAIQKSRGIGYVVWTIEDDRAKSATCLMKQLRPTIEDYQWALRHPTS